MDTEFKVDWVNPMFGPTLACPGCGKSTFVIHRGIMNESEVEATVPPREIAECFNCHIQTYAFALKTKYTSNDFPATAQSNLISAMNVQYVADGMKIE